MASDQFRQLSLLRRRHKAKAGLHCTDEAQNQAEHVSADTQRHVKNHIFIQQIITGFNLYGTHERLITSFED